MRAAQGKVHLWAYPYGDAAHDPWPGDTACINGITYRFIGTHWVWQTGGGLGLARGAA